VRGAAEAAARQEGGLSEPKAPTFWGILMTGLPGFLREGFLPLGAFYAGLKLEGLAAGIVAGALVSVPSGRPLAGALARAWYPFPPWLRETPAFKRVYAIESLVWGAYFLARSGIRLAVLLNGSLESFLLVTLLTGTPAMLLLLAWSIRYSIRGLADTEPPADALKTA